MYYFIEMKKYFTPTLIQQLSFSTNTTASPPKIKTIKLQVSFLSQLNYTDSLRTFFHTCDVV